MSFTLTTYARSRSRSTVLGAVGVLIAIGAWQALPATGIVSNNAIASASASGARLADLAMTSEFWSAVGQTLAAAGLGFVAAVVLGVAMGTLMGASRIIRNALLPAVEFLRPVPGVALIPVAILAFGPGLQGNVVLAAFGCVWVMIIQTLYGVASVDQVALQTARSFRMSWWNRIRFVQVPGALPLVATGLRICSSIALIIVVTAELVSSSGGIGRSIAVAQSVGRLDDMYAFIVTSGILGIAAQGLFTALERRLLQWHEARGTVA